MATADNITAINQKPPSVLTDAQFAEFLNVISHFASERNEMGISPDGLIDVPKFMELAQCKKDFAYQMFKNKELVQKGILCKITPINQQGGWRINWHKYIKWAKKNAEITLNA